MIENTDIKELQQEMQQDQQQQQASSSFSYTMVDNDLSNNSNEQSMNKKKPIRDPQAHRKVEKNRRDKMNLALNELLSHIPEHHYSKGGPRLDKISIVRTAIHYVQHMQELVKALNPLNEDEFLIITRHKMRLSEAKHNQNYSNILQSSNTTTSCVTSSNNSNNNSNINNNSQSISSQSNNNNQFNKNIDESYQQSQDQSLSEDGQNSRWYMRGLYNGTLEITSYFIENMANVLVTNINPASAAPTTVSNDLSLTNNNSYDNITIYNIGLLTNALHKYHNIYFRDYIHKKRDRKFVTRIYKERAFKLNNEQLIAKLLSALSNLKENNPNSSNNNINNNRQITDKNEYKLYKKIQSCLTSQQPSQPAQKNQPNTNQAIKRKKKSKNIYSLNRRSSDSSDSESSSENDTSSSEASDCDTSLQFYNGQTFISKAPVPPINTNATNSSNPTQSMQTNQNSSCSSSNIPSDNEAEDYDDQDNYEDKRKQVTVNKNDSAGARSSFLEHNESSMTIQQSTTIVKGPKKVKSMLTQRFAEADHNPVSHHTSMSQNSNQSACESPTCEIIDEVQSCSTMNVYTPKTSSGITAASATKALQPLTLASSPSFQNTQRVRHLPKRILAFIQHISKDFYMCASIDSTLIDDYLLTNFIFNEEFRPEHSCKNTYDFSFSPEIIITDRLTINMNNSNNNGGGNGGGNANFGGNHIGSLSSHDRASISHLNNTNQHYNNNHHHHNHQQNHQHHHHHHPQQQQHNPRYSSSASESSCSTRSSKSLIPSPPLNFINQHPTQPLPPLPPLPQLQPQEKPQAQQQQQQHHLHMQIHQSKNVPKHSRQIHKPFNTSNNQSEYMFLTNYAEQSRRENIRHFQQMQHNSQQHNTQLNNPQPHNYHQINPSNPNLIQSCNNQLYKNYSLQNSTNSD